MNTLRNILVGLGVYQAGAKWTYSDGCCQSKTVGSIGYTLVEKSSAAESFGCNSPCVYQQDGQPGSRVCFKDGILPVECGPTIIVGVFIYIHNELASNVVGIITTNSTAKTDYTVEPDVTIAPYISKYTLDDITAFDTGRNIQCFPLTNPSRVGDRFRIVRVPGIIEGCAVIEKTITIFNSLASNATGTITTTTGSTFTFTSFTIEPEDTFTQPIFWNSVSSIAALDTGNAIQCSPLLNPIENQFIIVPGCSVEILVEK